MPASRAWSTLCGRRPAAAASSAIFLDEFHVQAGRIDHARPAALDPPRRRPASRWRHGRHGQAARPAHAITLRRIGRTSAGHRDVRGPPATTRRATDFERNFMSRDPRNRRSLARAGRDLPRCSRSQAARRTAAGRRKALIFVSEGFARARRAPSCSPPTATGSPFIRSIRIRNQRYTSRCWFARGTNGRSREHQRCEPPARLSRRPSPISTPLVVSFSRPDRQMASFIPSRCGSNGRGSQARTRAGYWAPNAALAAAAATAAAAWCVPFRAVPLEPVHPALDRHVARRQTD